MPALLSLEEKIEVVLIVGDKYKTFREAADIFNHRHPQRHIHQSVVRKIFNKFKTSGNVFNKYTNKRQKRVANDDTVLEVMLSAIENPKYSLRKRASLLRNPVGKDTVAKILKENRFRPYKPQFIHTLLPRDYERRYEFCYDIQGMLEDDRFMTRRIMFSDEATFSSNGTVTSQNCRWWSDENPHFTIKARNQYSFKTNVWCGIYKNKILGPFFFRNTLNADRYLDFLQNELTDILDDLPIAERQQIWFQQDGAPCHNRHDVREYLDNIFNRRVIHRYSEIFWPARSPDLTPLDFFLWGFLKEKVYQQGPFRNVDHLERTIREMVHEINPEICRSVLRAFCKRTITCIEREGGYVEAVAN